MATEEIQILEKVLARDDLVGIAEVSPNGAMDALSSLEETEKLIRYVAERRGTSALEA